MKPDFKQHAKAVDEIIEAVMLKGFDATIEEAKRRGIKINDLFLCKVFYYNGFKDGVKFEP